MTLMCPMTSCSVIVSAAALSGLGPWAMTGEARTGRRAESSTERAGACRRWVRWSWGRGRYGDSRRSVSARPPGRLLHRVPGPPALVLQPPLAVRRGLGRYGPSARAGHPRGAPVDVLEHIPGTEPGRPPRHHHRASAVRLIGIVVGIV